MLVGGQDCHVAASGAHTGDISAEMLRDAGAVAVIVGHSERRSDHGETDRIVRAKAEAVHRAGLTAIVCVGETIGERRAGLTLAVVARQVAASLPEGSTAENTVVAYEPVWAIGTGVTPTPATSPRCTPRSAPSSSSASAQPAAACAPRGFGEAVERARAERSRTSTGRSSAARASRLPTSSVFSTPSRLASRRTPAKGLVELDQQGDDDMRYPAAALHCDRDHAARRGRRGATRRDACEALKSEQARLIDGGTKEVDMERGPDWAKANLRDR